MNQPADTKWMQLAIAEASKGIGLTSPNPPVGAVIIRDGQLLGKGWHAGAGKPHAEREAIADSHAKGYDLTGATIYITLEPCSTYGRTPPCTEGILEEKITRVVYGADDPNPSHRGRAEELLQAEGVEVLSGVEKMDCEKLIRSFSKVQQTGLPWVIIKSAISLDAKITRPAGEGQWLTSEKSRAVVQQMRYLSDAIITGGNTIRKDNPALTVRLTESTKIQPWRMVITQGKRSSLPADAQVFNDVHAERTLVQENGDLLHALKRLVEKGSNQVMVEAGGKLLGAFLNANLVDEVAIFYAPLLTGGPDFGISGLSNGFDLKNPQFTQIGNDVLLRALI